VRWLPTLLFVLMLHWMQSKIKERVMRPGQLHALRSQHLAHHSFHQQELLVINLGSEGGGVRIQIQGGQKQWLF
jgi:hypothetical protein